MISTATMIQLESKGNKMVDMQLSNSKLVDRGGKMIMDEILLPMSKQQRYYPPTVVCAKQLILSTK
jgi:N-acetylmuramic acid 6-phosphate etherase